MSAFQHHPEHIAAVVGSVYRYVGGTGATNPSGDLEVAVCGGSCETMEYHRLRATEWADMADSEIVASILQAENARSVACRYSETAEIQPPVTVAMLRRWEEAPLDVGPALLALDSIEYQSCESADWGETRAHRLCQRMRGHLISRLPGYRDAETWSINEPPAATRII